MTAPDLLRLGVIDAIVPEPVGGAHRDWEAAAADLQDRAARAARGPRAASSGETLVAERYEKFRRLGAFEEASVPTPLRPLAASARQQARWRSPRRSPARS